MNVIGKGIINGPDGYFFWHADQFSAADLVAYIEGYTLISDQLESLLTQAERYPCKPNDRRSAQGKGVCRLCPAPTSISVKADKPASVFTLDVWSISHLPLCEKIRMLPVTSMEFPAVKPLPGSLLIERVSLRADTVENYRWHV
jgi:hypothetical protein